MRFQLIIVALASVSTLLGGCSPPDPDQQVASARQHLAVGDRRTAFIELKSALQVDPNHATGRFLLGELHLAAEEPASAEKELRLARELGVPPEQVMPSLLKALLLQNRFDEVLALSSDPATAAAAPADFQAVRGAALLGLGDIAGAEQAITSALAGDPRNATALHTSARVQAAAGNSEEAIGTARELVTLHPTYGVAWSTLGGLLAGKQDFAGAEEAFSHAIELREQSLDDRLQRAIARLAQKKLDAAQDDIDLLLTRVPRSHLVRYAAGLWRTLRGQPDKAVEELEQSYAIDPEHPSTLFLLVTNYLALDKPDKAREMADRLVARVPGSVPGRILLGSLLLKERRAAEAAQMLRPVVAEQPGNAEAKKLLAMALLQQGQAAEAEMLLTEVVATKPASPDVQLDLGLAQLAGGRTAEGLATLTKAGELAPDSANVQAALVSAHLRSGNSDSALATALQFAKDRPELAEPHNLVGAVYIARRESDQAAEAFETALKRDPGNADASRNLAAIRLEQGRLPEADRLSAGAADRHPQSLEVALTRAAVLERLGDKAAFERHLDATIRRHPESAAPRLVLGQVLMRGGRVREAIAVLDSPVIRSHQAGSLLLAEAWLRAGDAGQSRAALEELDRASPRNPAVLRLLVVAYEAQGDWSGVERVLEQLSPMAPQDDRVKLARVRAYVVKGQIDEAVRLLSDIGLDSSDRAVLRTRLFVARGSGDRSAEIVAARALFDREPSATTVAVFADALKRAQESEQAMSLLKDWVDSHPEDRSAKLMLAGLYAEGGKADAGLSLYRRVLADDPGNVVALNQLAWYLRKTAPKEALEYAERAYGFAPDVAAIGDTLAMVLLELGAYQQALEANDRAVRMAPSDVRLQVHRAEILVRSGSTESSKTLLDELAAKDLEPGLREEVERLRNPLRQ